MGILEDMELVDEAEFENLFIGMAEKMDWVCCQELDARGSDG